MFIKFLNLGIQAVQAGNCGLVPCSTSSQACYILDYCDISVPDFAECSSFASGVDNVSIHYALYDMSPSALKNNGYCMTSNDSGDECNNMTLGCKDGLVCNSGTSGQCVALCEGDGDCSGGMSCRIVQYCDINSGVCSETAHSDSVLNYVVPETGRNGVCMNMKSAGDPCNSTIGCKGDRLFCNENGICEDIVVTCGAETVCKMGAKCQTQNRCDYGDATCTGTTGLLVKYDDVTGDEMGTCTIMRTKYGSSCNDSSTGCEGVECHLEDGHDGICGERCAKDDACINGQCMVPLACDAFDLNQCASDIGVTIDASETVTMYTSLADSYTAGFCMSSTSIGEECNMTNSSCGNGLYCRDGTCFSSNGTCLTANDCINNYECYIITTSGSNVSYKVRTSDDTTDGICMSSSTLGNECNSTSIACGEKEECSSLDDGICLRSCTASSDCSGTGLDCMSIEYCPIGGGDCIESATEAYGWYLKYSIGGPGYCMKTSTSELHQQCDAVSMSCGIDTDFVCSSPSLGICVEEPVYCTGDFDCTDGDSTCWTVMYCNRDTLEDCKSVNFSTYDDRAVIVYTKPLEGGSGLCGNTISTTECDGFKYFCGDEMICDQTSDGFVEDDHQNGKCIHLNRNCDVNGIDSNCLGGYVCTTMEYCNDDLKCSKTEGTDSKFIKYTDTDTGICFSRETAQEFCNNDSYGCEEGYHCNSTSEGACVKVCSSSVPCEEYGCFGVKYCDKNGSCSDIDGEGKFILYSDLTTGDVAGQCMLRVPLGEECDDIGLSCDPDQSCDWSDHFQTRKVCSLRCTSDETCNTNTPGSACFDVTYCDMNDNCSNVVPAEGTNYYMTYQSGSTNGHCMHEQVMGNVCNEISQSCYEGYVCDDGVCWAENRACKIDDECVGGRTCRIINYCSDDSEICSDNSDGMTSMVYEVFTEEEFGKYSVGQCFIDSDICDDHHNSCAIGYVCDGLTDGRCVLR